ncbi:unnamed protein product [Parnassius mnemosyne]|uniref:Reverse transcriptase domain-containing protein n=1 Tax=Parnassius mnemosyne TaxID=213953 RepID=A0AAV1KD30_9NEOP
MAAIHDQVYRQVCSALEAASSLQCIHIDHTRSISPSSLHGAASIETMASLVTDDDALAILGLLLAIKKTKRKDRSVCTTYIAHIQILRQIVQQTKEYNLSLCLAYVDYKKSFDSVEIQAVLQSLQHCQVDCSYINVVEC